MIQESNSWKNHCIKYYKRNFEAIKNNTSTDFNWSAFFLGPIYCAYRKMYALALLLTVFQLVFTVALNIMPPEYCIIKGFLAGIYVLLFVWLGNNANKIYYEFIKSQVQKGYNSIKNFKSTTLTLATIVFLDSSFLTYQIISILSIFTFAIIDYYSNPNISKQRKVFEVTDQTIEQYLTN